MSRKKVVEPTPEVKLVHRFTPRGNHRLELHSPTAEPRLGAWASSAQIAMLDNYRATTEYFSGILPLVFKISEVSAREVSD